MQVLNKMKWRIIKSLFHIACCVFVLIISSCDKQINTVEELEEFLAEKSEEYSQSVVKNEIEFRLQYLPTEAMMLRYYKKFMEKKAAIQTDTTLGMNSVSDKIESMKEDLQKKKRNLEKSIYFKLTICPLDKNKDLIYDKMNAGFGNYSEWLQKLLFSLNEYIYLQKENGDEVPLSFYHMDRNYGMSNERNFLLIFPREFNGKEIETDAIGKISVIAEEFGLHTNTINFAFNHLQIITDKEINIL